MATAARMTLPQEFMDCPACGVPIAARFALDATLESLEAPTKPGDPATAQVRTVVLGMAIQHDCIPSTPRTPNPERTTP